MSRSLSLRLYSNSSRVARISQSGSQTSINRHIHQNHLSTCRSQHSTRQYISSSINQLTNHERIRHFSSVTTDPTTQSTGQTTRPAYRVRQSEYQDILNNLQQDNIRNFSIIAHIDHGKSTLADRLLEFAGNIQPLNKQDAQVLDKLSVERERGITVKANSASMFYRYTPENQSTPPAESSNPYSDVFILNLIDTPGHVDFSYEVSRSLAACTGALLLIDASQGIQAQSLANYHTAMQAGLDIIPVLTKIDLQTADIPRVKLQLEETLGIHPDDVICVSSKSGLNVESIFPALIERFASPMGEITRPHLSLLFDRWYDHHRGVICLVHVVDGELTSGDHIASYHENRQYEVIECGLLMPHHLPCVSLKTGQVGYVIAQIRDPREARLGDTFFTLASKKHRGHINQATWTALRDKVTPLAGFQPARSMVFAGLFPSESSDFDKLADSMEKLLLSDPAVQIEKESSLALGLGFRCGFLGILHMDVFRSRLEDEFGASVLLTAPTVPYIAVKTDGQKIVIDSPAKFPQDPSIDHYLEPFVIATIITPTSYQGALVTLCQSHRGELIEIAPMGTASDRVSLKYELPLSEIVSEFYDSIKSFSSGYASFDYIEAPSREAPLVKVDIRINNEPVDALSVIVHSDKAEPMSRRLVVALKNAIDRQQIEIIIQAACGAKILARERVAPYRKDVLIKSGKVVGGGDPSRKAKLLAKQKEGKKRMKMAGNVELGADVFTAVMSLPK